MPVLKNSRHEKFCLALFEGKTATQAYIDAGYKACRQNAARLTTSDDIKRRLAELQGEVAQSAQITVESICRELDEAVRVAKDRGQSQAMVSASALKAKLAGLMVERVEVGAPGAFDGLASTKQIASRVLEELVERFVPVDQADLDGLVEMYERHIGEAEEYLASIRARPIVAERVDTRNLDIPWQQRETYSARSPAKLTHRTNGPKQV